MPLVGSCESCIPEGFAAVALPTATLSVIIPAFNEVRTVVEILQRVLRQSVVAEIVLVDDGSTDGTWEAVQQFAESADPSDRDRLVLLQHTTNRGKGRAIRTALEHVSGSHVLIQDADLEYDPEDIDRLWSVMQCVLPVSLQNPIFCRWQSEPGCSCWSGVSHDAVTDSREQAQRVSSMPSPYLSAASSRSQRSRS